MSNAVEVRTPAVEVVFLKVDSIEPGGTDQPRQTFDEEKQKELNASVKARGVEEPLVVRALPGGKYKLISGERRWRAAKASKLAEVPARVVEKSDAEAFELALVANFERDDLTPLDEGRAYKRLVDSHGYTVEKIVARFGKAKETVYGRLKLAGLDGKALKLTQKGELDAGTAEKIARLEDPVLRDEAVDVLHNVAKANGLELEDMTVREKREALDEWARQRQAQTEAEGRAVEAAEKALAAGIDVLDIDESEDALRYGSEWVRLSEPNHYDSQQRTWGKLLGDKVHVYIAIDEKGHPHKVARKAEVLKAAAAEGIKTKYGSSRADNKYADEQRRLEKAVKHRRAVASEAIGRLVEKAQKRDDEKLLRFIGSLTIKHSSADALKYTARRRGIEVKGSGYDAIDGFLAANAKMGKGEALGLMMELLIADGAGGFTYSPGYGEKFRAACDFLGLDLKRLEQEMRATEEKAEKEKEKQAKAAEAEAEKEAAAKKPGACVVVGCKKKRPCPEHEAGKLAKKAKR